MKSVEECEAILQSLLVDSITPTSATGCGLDGCSGWGWAGSAFDIQNEK